MPSVIDYLQRILEKQEQILILGENMSQATDNLTNQVTDTTAKIGVAVTTLDAIHQHVLALQAAIGANPGAADDPLIQAEIDRLKAATDSLSASSDAAATVPPTP